MKCSYVRGICTEEVRPLSQLDAEKITIPPKSDRRADISNYRVALLPQTKISGI